MDLRLASSSLESAPYYNCIVFNIVRLLYFYGKFWRVPGFNRFNNINLKEL